jgi:sRNA-binding protein
MVNPSKKVIEALDALKNDLPRCFKRGNEKQPIAIGIHQDVLKHYANDARFSNITLKKAIQLYTFATVYLKKVKAGVPRINLLGKKMTAVTHEEEANAKKILQERKEKLLQKRFSK